MGSWSFQQIGASGKEENYPYIKQVMECFGVEFGMLHDSEAGIIDYGRFNPEIMGSNDAHVDPQTLFFFLNKLFGNTYVYYESEEGSNTSDYYYREEEIYNPRTKKMYYGTKNYCYGDNTVFGDSFYCVMKSVIEKKAEERGITVSWNGDEDDYDFGPDWDNKEFTQLCEEVVYENSLSELGTDQGVIDIEMEEVDRDLIDQVIEKATERGYVELIELILKKIGK